MKAPGMGPALLLINPWIHDFAAYNLWSKPLGLLYLAGFLRSCGFAIHLIDCLEAHHPGMEAGPSSALPMHRAFGTGKFRREIIPKPPALKNIPRSYSRYGMPTQLFIKELMKVKNPSLIIVTSFMTYWYPGVREAISICRGIHTHTPVLLGGIYATLCQNHAVQVCGADQVVAGTGVRSMTGILDVLKSYGVFPENPQVLQDPSPYPAFDLLHRVDSVALLTTSGCPYRCQYCASPYLNPGFSRRDPEEVLEEIIYWHKVHAVRDFAFYDDAFLVGFESHAGILLEKLAALNTNLRLHTPNALHIREITSDVARLLSLAGFRTIRLGFETSDMGLHECLDGKVSEGDLERAVANLKSCGFQRSDIGAYVLAGLPDQTTASVMKSIEFVGKAGATPYLAEYSPIPHTPLWEKAVASSAYDISAEPLFHNNTLLPCWNVEQREQCSALKAKVREFRHS